MKRILVPTDFQHADNITSSRSNSKKISRNFLIHMLKYQAKLTTL
jgi:hypothetical protein